MNTTAETIRRIVSANAARALESDAVKLRDIGIDSLDQQSLAMECEDALGVELKDVEIVQLVSVADLIALCERAVSAKGGAA